MAWTAASHPKGVPTPTWEGRRSLRSLGIKGLKQTFSDKMSVGASYGNGSGVSLLLQSPWSWSP